MVHLTLLHGIAGYWSVEEITIILIIHTRFIYISKEQKLSSEIGTGKLTV